MPDSEPIHGIKLDQWVMKGVLNIVVMFGEQELMVSKIPVQMIIVVDVVKYANNRSAL